ncbi:uncharacterized protein B0H18DRAFT_1102885 [Fomitopsis serialis]|uniref:uncharacterized protein n=1 Tax=Fomitopsis serialis TaxID=139415 RepID=UPI0020083818|nr:uncharacterized protein B0H18DRAFT_1102885 [Neoantrodia serialis]KAH9930925.1 hypothetical protein B0H18DRAFT_1102885 [Neoantrodia serialis]
MFPPYPHSCLHTQYALFVSFLLSLDALAGQINRTIDDQYGDSSTGIQPSYSSNWNFGPECSICALHPSASDAFDGTWHDTTSNATDPTQPYVTLDFTGTDIWVYCIIVNSASAADIVTFTNVTFELDGAVAGSYAHEPDATASQYVYNVSVFSQTGLSNTEHKLVMSTVQGSQSSALLFDWAMYTFDDGNTSTTTSTTQTTVLSTMSSGSTGLSTAVTTVSQTASTSSSPTAAAELNTSHHSGPAGAIAGGVIGGLAFVTICVLLAVCFRRKRAASYVDGRNSREIDPFFETSHRIPRGMVSLHDLPPTSHGGTLVSHKGAAGVGLSAPVSISSSNSGRLNERHTPSISSGHDHLEREAAELRQQVATLRSAVNSTAPGGTYATESRPSVPAMSASSGLTGAEVEQELRREMATLRAEMAQLKEETDDVRRGEPPPAYM